MALGSGTGNGQPALGRRLRCHDPGKRIIKGAVYRNGGRDFATNAGDDILQHPVLARAVPSQPGPGSTDKRSGVYKVDNRARECQVAPLSTREGSSRSASHTLLESPKPRQDS